MLDASPTSHPWSPWKLAIVTGRSRPSSCELSVAQLQLLERLRNYLGSRDLDVPSHALIRRNFPFIYHQPQAKGKAKLLAASIANASQYLYSRTAHYSRLAGPHWKALLDSSQKVHLISGSCGLELLARSLFNLRVSSPIQVLALGPVANKQLVRHLEGNGALSLTVLRGERDWIASKRLAEYGQLVAAVGHLDYWTSIEVGEIACKWLFNSVSELPAAAAICPDAE